MVPGEVVAGAAVVLDPVGRLVDRVAVDVVAGACDVDTVLVAVVDRVVLRLVRVADQVDPVEDLGLEDRVVLDLPVVALLGDVELRVADVVVVDVHVVGVDQQDVRRSRVVARRLGAEPVDVIDHGVLPDLTPGAVGNLDAVLGDRVGRPDPGDGVVVDLRGRPDLVRRDPVLLVLVDGVAVDLDRRVRVLVRRRGVGAALHEDPEAALASEQRRPELDVAYRVVLDPSGRVAVVDPDEVRSTAVDPGRAPVDGHVLEGHVLRALDEDDRRDRVAARQAGRVRHRAVRLHERLVLVGVRDALDVQRLRDHDLLVVDTRAAPGSSSRAARRAPPPGCCCSRCPGTGRCRPRRCRSGSPRSSPSRLRPPAARAAPPPRIRATARREPCASSIPLVLRNPRSAAGVRITRGGRMMPN